MTKNLHRYVVILDVVVMIVVVDIVADEDEFVFPKNSCFSI